MSMSRLIPRMAVPALLLAAASLGTTAHAAELKLLSQGLPASAYTGGDAKSGKDAGPEKAFDGAWIGKNIGFNNGPGFPAWVAVDLGKDWQIIKTMTYPERTNTWYGYKVEVSADGKAWTMFADQTQNREASEDPAYTDMGGAGARYVRLTLTDAPDRDKQWFWPVVMEFQVYGVAVDPPAAPAAQTDAAK